MDKIYIDEGQMKLSVPQKPNSSGLFAGRKDVLDKLGEIFVHRANNGLITRHSCLLWGMGGIGKTQICLKFTEEMSVRQVSSHCNSQLDSFLVLDFHMCSGLMPLLMKPL